MTSPTAPTTTSIRALEPADAPAVGALTLRAYDSYGRIEGPYRSFLADPLLRVDGCTALLVAEQAGRVVGTVTYVLPGDAEWEGRPVPEGDCGFRVLAVDPAVESRGVGRRLVEHCLGLARVTDRHRMVITSMAWMTRAHRLYHGLGFTRRADLDVRFPGGVGVVFTHDLTAAAAGRFPPPGPVPAEPPWYEDAWSR